VYFLLLSGSTLAVDWPSWNDKTSKPHVIFGEPVYSKHDPKHNITRKYRAFTVYYDDIVFAPRWTAIKMTRRVADRYSKIKRPARFKIDRVLKKKKYKVAKHEDYNNLKGKKTWNRGHMVQFDDARGYGVTAAKDSFYTSNVCPQLGENNQRGWLTVEETCTEFARDYEVVWIYSGPIYGNSLSPFLPNRKIPKPVAFYKIVVSPGESDQVKVLAFRMPHEPISRDVDVSKYLTSIDTIEEQTNIDFLPDLDEATQKEIEAKVWKMWPDLPNN
jgi:endonuclease G